MSEWKKTQCNMCEVTCGLEMEVENNQIVSVRPDPDSPRSENYCCRKGRAAKYYVDNAERITQPLKRVDGKFVPISWQQAYKEIGEKASAIVNRHGPRSIGAIGGSLAASQTALPFLQSLLAACGSQYLFNPAGIEFMGSWWSNGRIYGDQLRFAQPDEHNTDVLVLWGCNPYVSHQIASARKVVRRMSQNPNKKVVVLDPRMTETAKMSDMHIALRPGTDSLFLRALIAYIIKHDMHDQAYLNKWAKDFDHVKHWFRDFDIEEALRVCQVPYEQMQAFCELICNNNWGVHQDLGVYCGRHNTLNSYLIIMLCAVTGSLLVPKNTIVPEHYVEIPASDERDPDIWRTRETGTFPVLGSFPAGSIAPEILSDSEQRIRVMFTSQSNPAHSYPNSRNMRKALSSLELLVCDDICMTETTRLAHYVLPATNGYEGHELTVFQNNFPKTIAQLRQPVVKPIGEQKENSEIWLDVADAMGLIPELPKSLYAKAEQAVRENDRTPYALALLRYLAFNQKYMSLAPMIVGKTLGKAMGSVSKSLLYAMLLESPLKGTDKIERAGIKVDDKHPILNKIPLLKDLCLMDTLFQKVIDTPEGCVLGITDVKDVDGYIREHIRHEDKKLHLYCDEINNYIKRITPEKEEAELNQYPMVISCGRHMDMGVNTVMRNPETYKYRKPFTALLNPHDAQQLGVKNGETIQLVTKAGKITAPAEFSYETPRGYAVIPHQFGLTFNGETYGACANELTREEDRDELTGNPYLRYVPCKIEKVAEGEAAG